MKASYRDRQLAGIIPAHPSLKEVREQTQYKVESLTADDELEPDEDLEDYHDLEYGPDHQLAARGDFELKIEGRDAMLEHQRFGSDLDEGLTPAQETICKAIENKVANAHATLTEFEKALAKYKKDPDRYAQQVDNMRQSARAVEVMGRAIGKHLSKF